MENNDPGESVGKHLGQGYILATAKLFFEGKSRQATKPSKEQCLLFTVASFTLNHVTPSPANK